jgi:hypothetical protein
MQDTAYDPTVIHAWFAAQLRQQRFNRRPLHLVQPKQLRHDPSPPGQLESDAAWSPQWVQALDVIQKLSMPA